MDRDDLDDTVDIEEIAGDDEETEVEEPVDDSDSDDDGGVTPPGRRSRAEKMATKQRSISISEFFAKNKQLLGFDSPARAVMTTVKEAVDNALDACEEAGILPELHVTIENLEDDKLRVTTLDNGPGIVKKQIPKIFGQLLYGSKFHSLKQSRGQQGIGISAAGMYGQLTTGRPVCIISRTAPDKPAHLFELVLDLKSNRPRVVTDTEVEFPHDHGTSVSIDIVGVYKSGRHSIDEYLAQTAVANPHAAIYYDGPRGSLVFPRVSEQLPPEAQEIRPHPYGVELGMLMKILRETSARTLSGALQHEFSRVTPNVAQKICEEAGVPISRAPKRLKGEEIEAIHKAIPKVKIMAPSATAIVPIGERLMRRGLAREISDAEFYISKSRPPSVYKGNPFLVEVALAYGGELKGIVDTSEMDDRSIAGIEFDEEKTVAAALLELPGFTRKKAGELADKAGVARRMRVKKLTDDEFEALRVTYNEMSRKEAKSSPAQIIRLANRVPLLYQQKACAISRAIMDINWRRYGITQPKGGFPQGALVIIVHLASVWVPFTSESKEAVAHYNEIISEMKLAIQLCARELGNYLQKKDKLRAARERKDIFARYTGELARAISNITGKDAVKIQELIETATERYTIANFETEKPDMEAEEAYQTPKKSKSTGDGEDDASGDEWDTDGNGADADTDDQAGEAVEEGVDDQPDDDPGDGEDTDPDDDESGAADEDDSDGDDSDLTPEPSAASRGSLAPKSHGKKRQQSLFFDFEGDDDE
ncbi:DNA topoisomerase VI subunit B [Myxococcota bacterium]|nr:DNA topoisomerase VI subunit B [Myxococcota bacterium]